MRNLYTLCAAFIAAIIIYRIAALVREANRPVYNIARIQVSQGTPVETLELQPGGELKFSLSFRNGRAFVANDIRLKLRKNMKVESEEWNAEIINVSNNIDFDTGLYEIRIDKKINGEGYAIEKVDGILIPRLALSGNQVWINEDGIARVKKIRIANHDAEQILVQTGLEAGDQLIVSSTANLIDGVKVK